MPLLMKKPFHKAPLPDGLSKKEEVFLCVMTNEIFRDYDQFCQRVILCNSMVWTCKYTEKSGLTYIEALESEKEAQKSLKEFSTQLRIPVLFLASKTHRTSFSEMVDEVYTFMKDRYFIGENVEVTQNRTKWKESHILQVIAPTEEKLKDVPKNGHFYPPSSLYNYEIEQLDAEDEDVSQIMIVNGTQIKRKRKFMRDKVKFFLRQYVTQNENSLFVVKEKVLQNFGISKMSFGQIFDGALPNFGFSKQKKKKQKFITEFLKENPNGVLAEKLTKAEEEYKQLNENLKQQKIAEKLKQQEVNVKVAALVKEWYAPKDDLELEDHKILPVPAPLHSTVPEKYIGDMLAVMEFTHTFSEFTHTKSFFPNGLTFDIMEQALTQKELEGPLIDLIQMLLTTIFYLQNAEKEQINITVGSGDEKIKDFNGNISLTDATYLASKASKWSVTHQGFALNQLPLYTLTTTEILRMHILSSGARLSDFSFRNRYQLRGCYMSEDDPALHLRLKYPHILKALALNNVNNLSLGDKLKIIHCLMNQILTYANVRDTIESDLEKSRQAKLDLKLHIINERKQEQEYNAKRAKIISNNTEGEGSLEKLDREYEKKKASNAKTVKNLVKLATTNQASLGQDRAFRKYLKLESVPGFFVSAEDDPGNCLDECVKQNPDLVGADRSIVLKHIRTVYEEMNSSDKENVESKDSENIENTEPVKINGVHTSTDDEAASLLMCSADSSKCQVHSIKLRQKWSFYYEEKQIDELIASLNERGLRESELKQLVVNDRTNLISTVSQTPIHILNPALQMLESEREVKVRTSNRRSTTGKSKYDNTNFGYPSDMNLTTILQFVLVDKILEMENNIYAGTIGSLEVDRNQWRDMLENKQFKEFFDTFPLKKEAPKIDKIKNEGANSRSSTPDITKEYKDPGEFVSSAIEIECEDSDVDYTNLLTISEEHRVAIQALSIALVHLGYSLEDQYLRKPLGNTFLKSGDKSAKGGLLQKWEQSLLAASSYDQIFLHYATLNKCILWTRSALLTKCQVCRKPSNAESMILCDSCNKGQHLFCFKPKLTAVPKDSWYCKDCQKEIDKQIKLEAPEPPSRKRRRRIIDEEESEDDSNHEQPEEESQNEEEEESEEEKDESVAEEDEEEEEEDRSNDESADESNSDDTEKEKKENREESEICTKCEKGGTLICCDKCLNMYHLECAKPPLRRVPRGQWLCHYCKAKKLQSSDSDSTSSSENTNTRRSKRRELDQRDDLPLHNAPLQEVLADVLKQDYAWPFIRPVVKNEVPDYYDIITKPMDFGTIKYKLNMGEYKCDADLMDDAALVFDNCNTYNSTDDEVYKCGVKLLAHFVNKCHEHGLKVSSKLENDVNKPPEAKRLCVD